MTLNLINATAALKSVEVLALVKEDLNKASMHFRHLPFINVVKVGGTDLVEREMTRIHWDHQASMFTTDPETVMFELDNDLRQRRFFANGGKASILTGLLQLNSSQLRQAFLDSFLKHLTNIGEYFHVMFKTSEVVVLHGERMCFTNSFGEHINAAKWGKLLDGYAIKDRVYMHDMVGTLNVLKVDVTKYGLSSHAYDGSILMLKYRIGCADTEYGGFQSRITEDDELDAVVNTKDQLPLAKGMMSAGHGAWFQWFDLCRYIPELAAGPTPDLVIFTECIKAGTFGETVNAKDVVLFKKSRPVGKNTGSIGGQTQISNGQQSQEYKDLVLSGSSAEATARHFRGAYSMNASDVYSVGVGKGMKGVKLEELLRRFFVPFEGKIYSDRRGVENVKELLHRAYCDKIRRSPEKSSRTLYLTCSIGIGILDMVTTKETGITTRHALYPCDVPGDEGMFTKYPATSNFSSIRVTPVGFIMTHDVIILGASIPGFISAGESAKLDYDGDQGVLSFGAYVEEMCNVYPFKIDIPKEEANATVNFETGIRKGYLATLNAINAISESDRAVRKWFIMMEIVAERMHISNREKISLIEKTAMLRELFIKSGKHTNIKGKSTTISNDIGDVFPFKITDLTEAELFCADRLFELTTADAGRSVEESGSYIDEFGCVVDEDPINHIKDPAMKFDSIVNSAHMLDAQIKSMAPSCKANMIRVIKNFPFIRLIMNTMKSLADLTTKVSKFDQDGLPVFINKNATLEEMEQNSVNYIHKLVNNTVNGLRSKQDPKFVVQCNAWVSRINNMILEKGGYNSIMNNRDTNRTEKLNALREFPLFCKVMDLPLKSNDDPENPPKMREFFSHLPTDRKEQYSIQRACIQEFFNKICERPDMSPNRITYLTLKVMHSFWSVSGPRDNQVVVNNKGFAVYETSWGTGVNRGDLFFMLPIEMVIPAILLLARGTAALNANPFLKKAIVNPDMDLMIEEMRAEMEYVEEESNEEEAGCYDNNCLSFM
jgi:hypothetical protein